MFSRSPTQEPYSPFRDNDVAITPPVTTKFNIQPLIPYNVVLHERQSPRKNVTGTVEAAARTLRRAPLGNTSTRLLRPNTSTQGKAQWLFTSYLPDIVTGYKFPETKIQKQSGTKPNKTPSQTQKTHHQNQRKPSFRITALLYIWGMFLNANTIQFFSVSKQ